MAAWRAWRVDGRVLQIKASEIAELAHEEAALREKGSGQAVAKHRFNKRKSAAVTPVTVTSRVHENDDVIKMSKINTCIEPKTRHIYIRKK
jgi:uncharacterized membrane protein